MIGQNTTSCKKEEKIEEDKMEQVRQNKRKRDKTEESPKLDIDKRTKNDQIVIVVHSPGKKHQETETYHIFTAKNNHVDD